MAEEQAARFMQPSSGSGEKYATAKLFFLQVHYSLGLTARINSKFLILQTSVETEVGDGMPCVCSNTNYVAVVWKWSLLYLNDETNKDIHKQVKNYIRLVRGDFSWRITIA